jgi:hypothetical protein
LFQKGVDAFPGKPVHGFKGSVAVRNSGIIAQITQVDFREAMPNLLKNREAPKAGIKNA